MTETEHGDSRTDLNGLSVEQAVDIVVDDKDDSGTVRETLAIVSQDGVVRRTSVDDALANASKVVTTAETRVELAEKKLDDVREVSASVPDGILFQPVSTIFVERRDVVETPIRRTRADGPRDTLEMRDHGDLYEIAQRIRQLTNAATEVQRAADDLQFELDSFEAWLTDADRRTEELTTDVDAVAESVGELDDVVDRIKVDDGAAENDAARTWAAATVRHRVVSLMITDLRSELATLRTWAEREGDTPPSNVESRLGEIRNRHEAVGGRLTARAEREWRTQYGDQLTAVDEVLEEMEPPVSWAEVEAAVEEHRLRSEGTSPTLSNIADIRAFRPRYFFVTKYGHRRNIGHSVTATSHLPEAGERIC